MLQLQRVRAAAVACCVRAVRYFAEQLSGELGREPSVKTVANLVATVSRTTAAAAAAGVIRQQTGGQQPH